MTPALLAGSALRLALVALRVAPLVALLPFLGGRTLPLPTRLAIAGTLALGLLPALAATAPPPMDPWLLVAALRELVAGLALALVVVTPFLALEHAGHLLDAARGSTPDTASALDTGAPTSPLAELLRTTGVVVFLASGGHRGVLRALAASLAAQPPEVAPQTPWHLARAAQLAARWSAESLAAALAIFAPALLALVATEFVLALAARFAPPPASPPCPCQPAPSRRWACSPSPRASGPARPRTSPRAPSPPRARWVPDRCLPPRGRAQRPQHFLYFFPLPHEHGSLRPGLGSAVTGRRLP